MDRISAQYAIIGGSIAILAVISVVAFLNSQPKAPVVPPDTYTVVQMCKAKFLHFSKGDAILKRDSDGKLFVRSSRGIEPAAEGAKLKDLCP